jgi:hypothetical protein
MYRYIEMATQYRAFVLYDPNGIDRNTELQLSARKYASLQEGKIRECLRGIMFPFGDAHDAEQFRREAKELYFVEKTRVKKLDRI